MNCYLFVLLLEDISFTITCEYVYKTQYETEYSEKMYYYLYPFSIVS